jgi:hypothetical protein
MTATCRLFPVDSTCESRYKIGLDRQNPARYFVSMEFKPLNSIIPATDPPSESLPRCTIRLTRAQKEDVQESALFSVALSELIAYADQSGRTRLNLTGRRIVEVAETTAQIDLLVRSAATRVNLGWQTA